MNYKEKIHKLLDTFITEYCTGDYALKANKLYTINVLKMRSSLHIFSLMQILGIEFYSLSDSGELNIYYFFDANMNKVIEHTDCNEDNEEDNCP